jgi:HK97 family phage portal protein
MALRDILRYVWAGPQAGGAVSPGPGTNLRDLTLANAGVLIDVNGELATRAGVTVTIDRAMQLSAVSACVRLLSESIASLPLNVYRRLDGGRRERVTSLPECRLLHDEPNQLMTSFTWRETSSAHLLLWGNAYSIILRPDGATPTALLPIMPQYVHVLKQANGELAYHVHGHGLNRLVNQADVLHVPGLAYDGLLGMSPIKYAAQSIGLALAAESYGAGFFGNSSIPSGFITTTSKLTTEQARALGQAWSANYGGQKSQGTAVLDNGAKFERITMPPEEAQFIETRKFQLADIARWYRVPPHMIGDLERATFANIEHQGLQFVTHTLRPWLVRFEQEITRKLFPSRSDGTPSDLYVEFNVDGLLRGDLKSRYDAYAVGRQWGWLSTNDIRTRENLEPVPDGDTDYLQPLNMVPRGQDPQGQEKDPS